MPEKRHKDTAAASLWSCTSWASFSQHLPHGLPHREYTISDGLISLVIERGGGINMIDYQGPRRTDGLRRGAFFSNGFWRRQPFSTAPALWLTVTPPRASTPLPVTLGKLRLAPFGVISQTRSGRLPTMTRLWVCGHQVVWEASHENGGQFELHIADAFLSAGMDESLWAEPEVARFAPGWIYRLRCKPPRTDTMEACALVASLRTGTCGREDAAHTLRTQGRRGDAIRFAIIFGESEAELEQRYRRLQRRHKALLHRQTARYRALAAQAPRLNCGTDMGRPLSDLFRLAPLYVESTRRNTDDNKRVAYRAATRGYGIWNGWDGQWGASLRLICNDDDAARYLEFLQQARGANGAIPMTVDYNFGPVSGRNFSAPPADRQLGDGYHICHEMWSLGYLHQVVFGRGDIALAKRYFPAFARSLHTMCGHASAYGLVASAFGGADYPAQIERPVMPDPLDNNMLTSRLSAVEDMALFFTGLHYGAELAALLGDTPTLRLCCATMQRLEQHFAPLFVDQETGYLRDSVWFKDNPVASNRFVRLTAMLALSGYGELLLNDALPGLAAFVNARMRHPELGLCDAPYIHPQSPTYSRWDDKWHQNATRETLKLARLTDDRELLEVQITAIGRQFAADRVIREDLFYTGRTPEKFKSWAIDHAASLWMNMTACAWWHGLLEALVGVRFERGQMEAVPGCAVAAAAVSNLHWGGHRWRWRSEGAGHWPLQLQINGRILRGVAQAQPQGTAAEQEVVVTMAAAPPQPLILSAGACAVRETAVTNRALEAQIESQGFLRLHFYAPTRPVVTIDGETLPYRWFAACGEGTLVVAKAGLLRIVIETEKN